MGYPVLCYEFRQHVKNFTSITKVCEWTSGTIMLSIHTMFKIKKNKTYSREKYIFKVTKRTFFSLKFTFCSCFRTKDLGKT